MTATTPRWYLSAAAVREYLAIIGLTDDDGGPNWGRAERELTQHCAAARLVKEDNGAQHWRTSRVGLGAAGRDRLEFTVSVRVRGEGPLDQLVRVRRKSAGAGHYRRRWGHA